MNQKPKQLGMFGNENQADLPLFSGTPVVAKESTFKPASTPYRQSTLTDRQVTMTEAAKGAQTPEVKILAEQVPVVQGGLF